MRWQQSKAGDTRTRSGFLLFPKRIGKEYRWWERAEWEEVYEYLMPDGLGMWVPTRWVNA